MSDITLQLLRALSATAGDDQGQPLHARAFRAWIGLPDRAGELKIIGKEASVATGAARTAEHVAVLGYAVAIDPNLEHSLRDGLAWLAQRRFFSPGRPAGYELDGLGLFGTALGLAFLNPAYATSSNDWFKQLLQESRAHRRVDDWNESLIGAAEGVANGSWPSQSPADLLAALASRGLVGADKVPRSQAWEIISGLHALPDGMTRGATQEAALTWLMRDAATLRLDGASIADAIRLLHGVQRSFRRWVWEDQPRTKKSITARWDVENEYHVQDFLWAILAPVFPDLDDEEWLKSLGQHHPRADLAIPSLKLIVEVKYVRKGKRFSEIITEVAADAGTYLQTDSGYTAIAAFIWDDSARTEEHEELKKGLCRIPGVSDAIVLSRPAKMIRSVPEASTMESGEGTRGGS